MKRSEQINELATALSAAQGAIKPAPKDAKNPHLRSRYTTLDSIIETIKSALAANGLAFTQLLASSEGGATLTTILLHSSGQWLSTTAKCFEAKEQKGVNALQSFGSALTYMKRYQLSAMLGISSGVDDDGQTSNEARPTPAKRKAKAAVKAAPNGRPLTPADLRGLLHKKAATYDAGPATDKQIPFVARKFAEAFAPAKDAEHRYHLSLSWLWSSGLETIDSATKLTFGQASATLDWLLVAKGRPDDSGDTPLHKYAPAEAAGVYKAALKEQGQADMFDAEEAAE